MNNKLKILFIAGLGGCAGLLAAFMGKLEPMWLLVFALPVIFPIFVIIMGSLKYALMALLILSLSIQMSFNPLFSSTQIGISISLTGLILFIIYTLWFLFILIGKKGKPEFGFTTLCLVILFGWAGLSVVLAVKPSYAILKYVNAVECFLIFFYAGNFHETKDDIKFIRRWVYWTVALTGLIAIGQFFFSGLFRWEFLGWHEEPMQQYYFGQMVSRPSAFLGHPNNLATFMVTWLPVVFVSIITENEIYKRVLYGISFGLGCLALIFTFSRGGWLSFISAILLIMLYFLFKRGDMPASQKIARTLGFCFVAVIIVVPFFSAIQDRLSRDDYGSGRARIKLANDAYEMIKEKPIEGRGLGFYGDFRPIPPHNIYLQTAAELGIVGLFLFAAVAMLFIRQGVYVIRNPDKEISMFGLALIAGLCGFCVHGMFELGTIGDPKFLSFFFIGGLLTAMGRSLWGEASP